jgi:PAS domain S-box-containing protein
MEHAMSPTDAIALMETAGKIGALVAPAIAGGYYGIGRAKRHLWDPAVSFFSTASKTFVKVDQIDRRSRHQDARLMALMGAQPEAMFETCDKGEFVNVNRALETITGFSRAQMSGMGWVNAIHPDDRNRVIEQWADAIHDERAFLENCRVRTSAGRVVLVRIEAYPMFDSTDQSVIGWHGRIEIESVMP